MDSLMNATTHSTTNRTEPTRPDRELPARERYPARASTIRHRLERAHNPKFRGSAAGPRRAGENPPLQRVGRIVGKAAEPVSKVHSDLGVRGSFGSAHLHSGSPIRPHVRPWGATALQNSEVAPALEVMWVAGPGCMSASAASRVGKIVGSGFGRRAR